MVDKAKKVQYEVEHVYVDVDRQKFWDLFVATLGDPLVDLG